MSSRKKYIQYTLLFEILGIALVLLSFLTKESSKYNYIFGFVGLSYIFSGFTFLSSHMELNKRKSHAYKILALGLLFILTGVVFRWIKLEGASLFLMVGFFLIALTFVPIIGSIRSEKWKNLTSKKWHSIVLGFGDITGLSALIIGVLGKIFHWPYMDILLIAGAIVLVISLYSWNNVFSMEVKLRISAEEKLNQAFGELKHQHKLIEEKNEEILDSINYARRIQYALLAGENILSQNLNEHFVLFQPKDVVSGDFYWATPSPEGFFYITADCTGHGVPGAFMSLLNISKLNQAINENKIYRPDLILNKVRNEIIKALNPEGSSEESKDGMDAVLCKIDRKSMKLEYAAANNSFYIIRNGEMLVCKADKMPVGKGHDDSILFSFNEIALQTGDVIYTFTDGYADQFGGPKGKKFKYKQLEEYLLSIHTKPMNEQKDLLSRKFTNWKGELEQVDDVTIIGVRV